MREGKAADRVADVLLGVGAGGFLAVLGLFLFDMTFPGVVCRTTYTIVPAEAFHSTDLFVEAAR